MSAPARMWTLAEVVALTRGSLKHAYNRLEKGRYPIAAVKDGGLWRFTDADVRAFVERREITNPRLAPTSVLARRRYSAAQRALLKFNPKPKAS